MARRANGRASSPTEGLVRVLHVEQADRRQEQDVEVEPQRPVLDVVEVVFDAEPDLVVVSTSPRQPLICAQPVTPGLTLCRAK